MNHRDSNRRPVVSVVLPVYNCEKYILESVNSILGQTFPDFELIIINDGSSDGTKSIVENIKDSRIRFYSQKNKGLPASLNWGIHLSRGKYIARQDADDVSFPERLAKQVERLENNPDLGLLGTWAEIWEAEKRSARAHCHPTDDLSLRFQLLFENYFVHTSVMFRKSVLERIGLYSLENFRQPEDYELWSRFLRNSNVGIGNLPEKLVAYREVDGSICRSGTDAAFQAKVMRLSAENISWAVGRSVDDRSVQDMVALSHASPHLASQWPNFKEIRQLLENAIKRVGRPCEDGGVDCANSVESKLKEFRRMHSTKNKMSRLFFIMHKLFWRKTSFVGA